MSGTGISARVISGPLLLGLGLALIPIRAEASEGPPPVLNPTTYASPSGKYTMFVDPSDIHGRGKGFYRLKFEGRDVWSGEKPYTLWEAAVADDGLVAGYAYSHGWRGFSEAGYKDGMGDFRVVVLDPQGKERVDHVTKREHSHFFHIPPNPLATGLILDSANDRFVVRVADADINRGMESCWTYRLSTGKALEVFRLKNLMADPDPVSYIMDAKSVAGTPLAVVHWWRYEGVERPKLGARFTLIGPDGKPVWTLDLPTDYTAAVDAGGVDRLRESLGRSGGILRSDQPGRFELRFVKDAKRVTFAVARDAKGAWTVAEVERRPFVEAVASEPKEVELPVVALRPTGRIVLKGGLPGVVSEIRDVNDFVVDGRGRIAFPRWSEDRSQQFVAMDRQGENLRSVTIQPKDAANQEGWTEAASVGSDKYVVLRPKADDRHMMEGALVDVASGKLSPIAGFATTILSKAAGFPDGGFVVLGGLKYSSNSATGDDSLSAFDSTGKRLWSIPGNGDHNDPAALSSPEDIAVTTDGLVAVVDVIRHTVQFFDRAGKHRRTVDLKKSWGREPNYPSEISADLDGGVVVWDFHGDPPIVRMKADGTVKAQVTPRLKIGRAIDLRHVQAAPDGALWVSDGHALYRLADTGVADRVLGRTPDPMVFDKAAGLALDREGRIYAVDGRTGAVHVFDPDGRWLRVCVPDKDDVVDELHLPRLTVSDRGDVYLGLNDFASNRFLHFSPEGERVGIEESKLDESSETWLAQPGTGLRWVLGYNKVYLMDAGGTAVRTIARRADRNWLENPQTASTAPDGSIAVTSQRLGLIQDPDTFVNLYSPKGEPIRTFKLPRSVDRLYPEIAFDGKHLVVAGGKAVAIFDASGKPVGKFEPAPGENAVWTPFLTSGGRRLVLFDGSKTLHSFDMP